jgi:hypothetical protein
MWTAWLGVGFGAWVGFSTEVDAVPAWFLGLGYAAIMSAVIVGGVVVGRWILQQRDRDHLAD